ncbi:hypothetical protein [Nocardia spumae]|uniref:hypothetical protein n=1 Tax=Nocardia spumae TaxID=2887190 RepID=UPI001D1536D7|nr:hypothetical protein [Nocardia spumae]
MKPPHSICQYCSHRNGSDETRCGHCGAPLPLGPEPHVQSGGAGHPLLADTAHAALEAGRLVTGAAGAAEKIGAEVAKAGEGVKKVAGDAEKGAAAIALPEVTWKIAIAGIAALLVVAVMVIHSCGVSAPPMIGQLTPVEALPDLVRAASSCRHVDSGAAVDNCVIPADHPLLSGGITGGRQLTFTVRDDPPQNLAAVVDGWRAAGGTVIADGTVFIAVGPSATVWYADTRSGLRIETATFTNRAAAQTFLYRSGLIR